MEPGSDRAVWKMSPTGGFSVKSTYELLVNGLLAEERFLCKLIWRWKGPQRVPGFVWLVGHGRLLTNELRFQRGISENGLCSICHTGLETTIHVLRDCDAAKMIWKQLVPRNLQHLFFSDDGEQWMIRNPSSSQSGLEGLSWALVFGAGIIFKVASNFSNLIFIADFGHQQKVRERRLVGWTKPCHGWHKLNTDGAVKGNPGCFSARSLLQDEDGRWVGGFVHDIRFSNSIVAELWAVKIGLDMVCNLGTRKPILEVDPEAVHCMLRSNRSHVGWNEAPVKDIYNLMERSWMVVVEHVYRERIDVRTG
ncbi:hypothetical protein CRG98_024538 [Punica granatum]|uniref:RNase H type-1 domain-containing protein n=1 Tax=Punica granatum TaxID=22663 RepID=A0A2I0JFM7_PUNGR|nr:hypothetical protein CRG98_024538 [Punica granatum]